VAAHALPERRLPGDLAERLGAVPNEARRVCQKVADALDDGTSGRDTPAPADLLG
jgi:hypothetical protein